MLTASRPTVLRTWEGVIATNTLRSCSALVKVFFLFREMMCERELRLGAIKHVLKSYN